MAKYQSSLGNSSPQIGGGSDQSLFDAFKERYDEPGSLAIKILSTLALPQQIVASMMREAVDRAENPISAKLSYGQAALRGVSDPRTSYGDIQGVGRKTGVFLDIVADPLWFMPQKWITAPLRLAGKPVKAAAVLAIDKSPLLDHVVTRVARRVSKNYERVKAGFGGYEGAVETKARQEMLGARYDLVEGVESDLRKLVPDRARRERILEIAEEAPPGISIDDPMMYQHIGDALKNEDEVRAFHMVRELTKAGEVIRTKRGLIGGETAAKFEQRTGLSYQQRVTSSKDDMLSSLDDMISSGRWTGNELGMLQKARQAASELDTVSDSYIRALQRLYESAGIPRPSFSKHRTITKSIRELRESDDVLDAIAYATAEKDVARVMHVQGSSTANALYRASYLENFKKFGFKEKFLVKTADLEKGVTPKLRGKGASEMVPIEGVEELKGYHAPRVLAEDMKDVLMSPLDPNKVKNATSILRRVNVWMKAWLLAAPMTVSRNAMDSVIWRNAAGGMTVKDVGHIGAQFNTAIDAYRGMLSASDAVLWKEMYVNGIVRSNIFRETEGIMESALRNKFKRGAGRLANPMTNPYSKALFSAGGFVEDVARGSMYRWQRSLGKTIEESAAHVNHWHIDYLFGLTKSEQHIRDYLMPFYTFTSRNMPLTLETLLYRTKLVAAGGHAKDAWEDLFGGPEPDVPMAGWMASGTPMRLKYDKQTGTYNVAMLDGLASFTDINKFIPSRLVNEAVSMIYNTYSAPYEIIANHKLFPEPKQGRPVERPGDQFDLIGVKASFPFSKRVEYLMRQFRPLNEVDRWIEAASSKYDDSAIQRARNVFNRMLVGKVYPVTREQQIMYYKAGTNEQLDAARRIKKIAEERGDTDASAEADQKIRQIKEARRLLGVK